MNGRPLWTATFLAALEREGGVVIVACERAGISRSCAYGLRLRDPDFAAEWEAAAARSADAQLLRYLQRIQERM